MVQRLKPIALSTLHAFGLHRQAFMKKGLRILFEPIAGKPSRLKRFVDFDNHAPQLFAFEMQGLLEIARRAGYSLTCLETEDGP